MQALPNSNQGERREKLKKSLILSSKKYFKRP
jgi:hypothetical protein